MTINEEVPIHIYTGNGIATEFSYTFTIFDDTDIVLTLLTIASGIETNITSNYTVNDTLKKVTYPVSGSPLTSAYKLVISRNVPDEQAINFTSSGAFNTTNITESLDKVTMNIQEVKEELSRCVKWKISTDPITTTDAEDFLGGGSGTTPGSVTWGDIAGALSNQTDLNNALAGKSSTSHNHSSTYSAIGHDHSGTYSDVSHNHSSTYSNKVSSSTDGNFTAFSGTSGTLKDSGFNSSSFASSTHNHSGTYSETGHNHSGTYQGLDTELTAFAGIILAADTLPYATGSTTMSTTTFTEAARTLMDDSSASNMRTTLGVKELCGFENRTASAFSMSGSDFQITTGTNYNVWVAGTKYNFTTTQTVAIANNNTMHFIYFNTSGVLTVTTTAWNMLDDIAPVATVFKSGSNYAIGDERHYFERDRSWHASSHATIGTRYESGGVGTFTNTTLSITRLYMYDEDIRHDTGGTKTVCSLFYRYTGGGAMAFEPNISTPYKANAGVIQWDNSGTLTNAGVNDFVCYYVYGSNDIAYPVYVLVGQNVHGTIALARAESLPVIVGIPVVESKLLYRLIYKNVGGTATYQEPADYRSSSSLPAGSSPVTNASSIAVTTGAFSGNVLTTAETTAQAAFDKLDTYLNARRSRSINVTIGDGTTVPSTGSRIRLTINTACTIINWYVVADASGSCVVDVKRSGTSIVGGSGNKPTLSSAQRANATVASWTSVAIAAYDELEFYLDSVTTCKQINLMITVTI